MASAIDANKPPVGRGAKTEDIRANFLVARNEITQLQDVAVPARAARAGDLGGTTASTTVQGLRGVAVSPTAPTANNQALLYNGVQWAPGAVLRLSGDTLTGNLYLPAGTPTQPNQAITLGYLNTRINEFVTSGGNTFPDAPTSPSGIYGRRHDRTWQPVPEEGPSAASPRMSGSTLLATGEAFGRRFDRTWVPVVANSNKEAALIGRLTLGGSGRGANYPPPNFLMGRGGMFEIHSRARFNRLVRFGRLDPDLGHYIYDSNRNKWLPHPDKIGVAGGIVMDRGCHFIMSRQWYQHQSKGPRSWPRANFRNDSMAAFNSTVWTNENLYTNGPVHAVGVINAHYIAYSHSANWTTFSDERVKQDIEPYQKGLDALLQLQPITFRYNGRNGLPGNGHRHIGLSAQAVNPVMPEMIGTHKGRVIPANEGEDEGEVIPEILTLNSSPLIYTVINALREINARLTALESK